jgi:uncharacterized protein (DUF433 family)
MKLPARVEAKADVIMGKPCIRGTRIPVYLLLQKMGAGETPEQILDAYLQLHSADLTACIQYAAALASEEVVVLAEA